MHTRLTAMVARAAKATCRFRRVLCHPGEKRDPGPLDSGLHGQDAMAPANPTTILARGRWKECFPHTRPCATENRRDQDASSKSLFAAAAMTSMAATISSTVVILPVVNRSVPLAHSRGTFMASKT